MTSQYRHRRTSAPDVAFTALEPGEIAVNTSNRQLTVGDAASGTIGAPVPLLAIRLFDTRAIYAINDYVVITGGLYRAKIANGPGVFNPSNWDAIAGQQIGPFVQRTGDVMLGQLSLPPGPGLDQAVRRDYVDSALAPYATRVYVDGKVAPLATTTYVNAQDALAVPKAGGIMTGSLTLSGPPTAPLHAATQAYVDSRGLPPGMIADFAVSATPPDGWLTCDGQAVSRTVYVALFSTIGTLWGAGDGSTTFNVPNFMSRFRRHRDNDPNYAGVVGTLKNPANLDHTHPVNLNSGSQSANHAHYVSGTSGSADRSLDHLHGGVPTQTATFTSGSLVASGGATYVNAGDTNSGAVDRSIDHLHSFGAWSGSENANHIHSVNGSTGTGTADSLYETRPYSATVLTCIKY